MRASARVLMRVCLHACVPARHYPAEPLVPSGCRHAQQALMAHVRQGSGGPVCNCGEVVAAGWAHIGDDGFCTDCMRVCVWGGTAGNASLMYCCVCVCMHLCPYAFMSVRICVSN